MAENQCNHTWHKVTENIFKSANYFDNTSHKMAEKTLI